MRRLSLTSWSLNNILTAPEKPLSLLELPRKLSDAGIRTLEICHFHLPSTDADYLAKLKAALDDAGIELWSILIDTGDITQTDAAGREADMRLIEGWIDVASTLGARVVRVVAGNAPPSDEAAIQRSIEGLRSLAAYGKQRGVEVLTENFRALASTAENCNRILDELGGEVALCADIGNFPPSTRVEQFAAVVNRAKTIHVKPNYDAANNMDPAQMRECLTASVEAGFEGPYTLVYDHGGDEWVGIAKLKALVEPYVN